MPHVYYKVIYEKINSNKLYILLSFLQSAFFDPKYVMKEDFGMTKYDRMVEVNQERSRFKEETAIRTMRKLYDKQEQITVKTLVDKTGLSRAFFYKNEMVNSELERLRAMQSNIDFTARRRIILDKVSKKRIVELEKENEELKKQIIILTERNNLLEKAAQKRKVDYFNEL